MIRTSSHKNDGTFAGRAIAVLIISASALLGGVAFGYAAASVGGAGSTSVSVYGPSHLKAPLTDASISVATGDAAVSPSAAPAEMAPLTAPAEMAPLSVPAASTEMAPLTVSTSAYGPSHLNGPLK